MSCRLRVDRDPGQPVLEALRQAGHDVDLVNARLAARGAAPEEVFASAAKAGRVLVTADPSYADVARFDVAESQGLVLLCVKSSTLCDAVDSVYEVQLEVLNEVRRADADAATAAKRLELSVEALETFSGHLYRTARQAVTDGDRETAREALARRADNYEQVRWMTEQRAQLDESLRVLLPILQSLRSAADAFRTEKEVMKASTLVERVTSMLEDAGETAIEAITANLIEALAAGAPQGALWLVLPDATWEIPAPYLKGPTDVSPRPRRRDADGGM
jgi:hypothetical protein